MVLHRPFLYACIDPLIDMLVLQRQERLHCRPELNDTGNMQESLLAQSYCTVSICAACSATMPPPWPCAAAGMCAAQDGAKHALKLVRCPCHEHLSPRRTQPRRQVFSLHARMHVCGRGRCRGTGCNGSWMHAASIHSFPASPVQDVCVYVCNVGKKGRNGEGGGQKAYMNKKYIHVPGCARRPRTPP